MKRINDKADEMQTAYDLKEATMNALKKKLSAIIGWLEANQPDWQGIGGGTMKMPLLFMISMFAGCDSVEPNRQPKPADLPMRKTEYSTNSITATNAPGSGEFMAGLPLPDGCVLFMPNNSTSVRIYNSVTDTLNAPTEKYPGSTAFRGGVLLLDGRVFFKPDKSTPASLYNPVTDTLSILTETYPGSCAFIHVQVNGFDKFFHDPDCESCKNKGKQK